MGPDELVGPLQISVWWYVAAGVVLLASLLNLFAPLLRAAAGSGMKSRPRIPIPVRSTYMSRIAQVESKLGAGETDVRDSARDLAKIVREFARDAWGVRAEHLTYRDAAVAGLDDLAESLSSLYAAEFAEDDANDLGPQIAGARKLVTRWS
ncbi:hypothetical protein SAMN04489751_3094 [Brevibacterium sandarakinum]|uniref:Uncharacterized protein n=1 Tax=Brevibacterium sandarakinum TaxID=629680 RepID=A0A1H1VQJ2_BRESA|nr:hypothetical protein [Brevibacterium sandarakinum]MDN5586498.1 hypothetical protein [Brevibacterium sp.]MDN5634477.1 hypothetical protein [Brevibacterium sp.]MDN5658537.1 hypothetical protein [Brevibacterium sandarakinum]SDS87022.1 hypothetical protein SAMN04489751_3094 [Brevibacterium sandarakinum]